MRFTPTLSPHAIGEIIFYRHPAPEMMQMGGGYALDAAVAAALLVDKM